MIRRVGFISRKAGLDQEEFLAALQSRHVEEPGGFEPCGAGTS